MLGSPKEPIYHFSGERILMPKSMTLQTVEGKTHLHCGQDSMMLPTDFVAKYVGRCSYLSPHFDQDRCYIAFHECAGYSFWLRCLDRESGKKLWESEVWASANLGYASGIWDEHVALLTKGEQVFVVGSG